MIGEWFGKLRWAEGGIWMAGGGIEIWFIMEDEIKS